MTFCYFGNPKLTFPFITSGDKVEINQGPRSKFSSGGAKEECVKENFGGGGGCMLVDFYSISLK